MAKWGDSLCLSLLKPLLFIRVKDRERFGTLFYECGEDGSNVFLSLPADQSGLQNSSQYRDLKVDDVILVI